MTRSVYMRWFVVYAVVELATVIALTWVIGFGWTLLALLGTFALGLALAGSRAKQQIERLQRGLDHPRAVLNDSRPIALGTLLVLVPGIVTTVAGLLLLVPRKRRPDYIDGEVIDVVDVEPPALPR